MSSRRSRKPLPRHLPGAGSPLGRVSQAGERAKTQVRPGPATYRVFGRYALVYLLAGQGVYADANTPEPRPLRPGDVILVHPRLPHRYGPRPGDHWHEVYLVFEGPAFDAWASAGLLDEHRPVTHLEPVPSWRRRIESVLEPDLPIDAAGALVEVCRLQQLLADMLAADVAPPRATRHASWLAQARAALADGADARDAARELGCSYATFRRRFTRLAGCPPAQYQAQQRIERACNLMRTTDRTDRQIAYELGFCDEFHFSRRFKQIAGITPRAFRRSLP